MSIFDPSSFVPQQTVSYKTFLKSAFVQALGAVYELMPDPVLQTTLDAGGNKLSGVTVTIEYPTDSIVYPCIVVGWIEQYVRNAGVGHIEWILDENTNLPTPFRHAHYQGQIELAVYALSSLDRDLVSDSLVQIMRMPDMATYTTNYYNQIFNDVDNSNTLHYINVDTDNIRPVGESVQQVPWGAENALQYKSGYRANVFGEFYSLPPDYQFGGYISEVDVYPYVLGTDPVPDPDPSDPAPWLPPDI
jgi:hypothetical protein